MLLILNLGDTTTHNSMLIKVWKNNAQQCDEKLA